MQNLPPKTVIDKQKLDQLISQKIIENVDLSNVVLEDYDFSDCHIKNVKFTKNGKNQTILNRCTFNRATLEYCEFDKSALAECRFIGADLNHCYFEDATLEGCNFDSLVDENDCISETTKLTAASFKKAILNGCRFRYASVSWSDFRYAQITRSTFQSTTLELCDFYRTEFQSIVVFLDTVFKSCSFDLTSFEPNCSITRANFEKSGIVHDNEDTYNEFLVDWKKKGPSERTNNTESQTPDLSKNVPLRHSSSERIYKYLDGFWRSKGHLADANWAYVEGKRHETAHFIYQFQHNNSNSRSKPGLLVRICLNKLKDFFFGYGESLWKMTGSYILVIFVFSFIYVFLKIYNPPQNCFFESLKNMVGQGNVPTNIHFLKELLMMSQTTLGVILTGIFGFMLGNKIRNS